MSSITLGVAALVAINSFRTNAEESVKRESRALLGADARVWSNRPFPKNVETVLDSADADYDVARVTTLISMGVIAGSGDTRLVQVRAVESGYPFYGDIETEPAGRWSELNRGGVAIVDENLLSSLGAKVGDTLMLGDASFRICASLTKPPADFSFRNAIGPRVYIASTDLAKTGLLQFGSLAQYQMYLRIPNEKLAQKWIDRRHDFFRRNMIGFQTATEQGENFAKALDALSRFLALVGLAALLLGGIGVATAVHVFVKSKHGVVAVLRCLGADQSTVFAAYLIQAVALSFIGAAIGVVMGFAVQALLPRVMSAVVPFDIAFRIDWSSVAMGLGVGVAVALLFAVIPLLSVRGVSPLQALRADYEPIQRKVDPLRVLSMVLLILGMAALSIWQAQDARAGLAFTGGLAATLLILLFIAWSLTRLTRKLLPSRARFTVRQGIANLYRPRNQTVSVILSLGFGVFVIATMLTVQTNLLGWLNIEHKVNAPNLLAFDVQEDQRATIESIFRQRGVKAASFTPIVPGMIHAIDGVAVDSLLSNPRGRRVQPWALRREYRNTYRDTMVASEKVVQGTWFGEEAKGWRGVGATTAMPISIEEDVARDLSVKLGSHITWDFQGVLLESEVTSIRDVDWAQFNTNFFVVFPTGVLEKAPHTYVVLGRLDGVAERAALQRELVKAASNVSVMDIASVRAALDSIINKVTLAIRFMALFSIVAGIIVLIGAVATSRFQRLRESALLKTIGATRRQITEVLVTEYAALGILAGATGVLLGGGASALLVKYFFKLDFRLPVLPLLVLWMGVSALAVTIGLLNSRDIFRRAPLAVLREISE